MDFIIDRFHYIPFKIDPIHQVLHRKKFLGTRKKNSSLNSIPNCLRFVDTGISGTEFIKILRTFGDIVRNFQEFLLKFRPFVIKSSENFL